MLEFYMVVARVNGIDYLTKVNAESNYSAEHQVMDLGICGKHDYSVTACMAFDHEAMKTDTFIGAALNAVPIGFGALSELIQERNKEILKRDETEHRISAIEKKIQELTSELEAARKFMEG